ncbi:unnamed protein product [Prunus armeniaca]|uniref:Uncharacterized protein n=1 Tax=Prunus armeniaca TaxID=36596 RepID=A0A6J5TYN7_PRUAR|nr:unnamed protein product [Prunus armeniaca]
MTGREGYTQKTVCYKTLSQLLVLKNQDHFSSCCPRWKAISSVSEVKMLKLLKQKFIMHGS